MVFTSIKFLVFFPVVCILYYCIPHRLRYLWLLAASYYFYMCWNAKYALLMAASTLFTYASGLLIARADAHSEESVRTSRKKLWVGLCFALNLAILIFFKYFDFILLNLSTAFSWVGITMSIPKFDVLLPVGISFYTFQALSYTMDVYRGEIPPQRNVLKYALFVSFFPQLVAGPIERSKNLLTQIDEEHHWDAQGVKDGLLTMLYGFFLKLVIADRLAVFVDAVYGNIAIYDGGFLLLAALFFTLQIYCDFYGYSVIAKGAAQVMGFRLMDNFNAPYLSVSIHDFWNRWHISLTSWFRDYLYIPLGGNRKGTLRKYLNIMLVFLLSGLWHGASWNFIMWGGVNGLYQVFSALTQRLRDRAVRVMHITRGSFGHTVCCTLFTFALVCFAFIFFRAANVSEAFRVIGKIFTDTNPGVFFSDARFSLGLDKKNMDLVVFSVFLLFCADILKKKRFDAAAFLQKQDVWFRYAFIVGAVMFVLIFGWYGPLFSSASFIYFQF